MANKPATGFPDPDDKVLIPRLDDAQRERIATRAGRRSFAAGATLFEQGMRDAPFFVIERGCVDFYDSRPATDHADHARPHGYRQAGASRCRGDRPNGCGGQRREQVFLPWYVESAGCCGGRRCTHDVSPVDQYGR